MASVEVLDAEPAEATAFLAELEAASGIPPVDEDEQRRLAGLPPVRDPGWRWGGHLVTLGGVPVAYAGIRMPPPGAARCAARVDLAVVRDHPEAQPALAAALEHLRSHARAHAGGTHTHAHVHDAGADAAAADDVGADDAGVVEAWLRGASTDDLTTAAGAGFTVQRRLHVLKRDLHDARDLHDVRDRGGAPGPAVPTVPAGLRVRPFDPAAPSDADAVVRLLARAYPEVAGRGRVWDAQRLATLRDAPWFRAEDLLLLEEVGSGRVAALHWMKRRGGRVGEVYNLAVDPDGQGRGHGPLLLDVGLAHLVAVGCDTVVLWVDAANVRALALYRSRGFTHRWDDVSLVG